MRVLHILEATSGGTRQHILDLLPALQARGIANSLIYSSLRNPAFREDATRLQSKSCETYEIAMGRSWQRAVDRKALVDLRAHLKNHRYDIIHCHSSNAGLMGRLANWRQRRSTPLVYTPHYIAFAAGLPIPQRRMARWLEKILAPQTSFYIAVSQHEYSVMQRAKLLRNRNAELIYNGVDASQFSTDFSASEFFTIGCFGRLTAQKNQSLLLRALPIIAREIPNVRLRLVGDGEDASTLRALSAKLQVENLIQWRGEVRDAKAEYSACDLIAQPSRWEGCSYALLEASASGKAIIASDIGGNREVVGPAGVLLPARNANLWAQNIVSLSHNAGQREALGHAARARVASRFQLQTMVEKTINIYQRVLL